MATERERALEGQSIVRDVAARLARQLGGRVPTSDLVSLGNEALVTLIRAYDPKASPFEPYLRRFVRWAMLDGLRGPQFDSPLRRRTKALTACLWLAAATGEPDEPPATGSALDEWRGALSLRATGFALSMISHSIEFELPTDSTQAPDRVAMRQRERQSLRTAVAGLDDALAREVVERHYFGEEPFEQIATAHGLSPTQICRIHRRALVELDAALRRQTQAVPGS
jgi:RNA polymerase sigma factor for flagellar operon FliA